VRASSLVYRVPSSSDIGGSGSGSDHNHHPNSGYYPVVGVASSSKLMSDILLQFHQEAEAIDLLGVNAIQDCDSSTTGDIKNSSNTSFFQKHQSQFQELLLQHQQKRSRKSFEIKNHSMSASKIPVNTLATTNDPNQSESLAAKGSSNNEHDDVSHSSSMMMMSMNSSTTTMMSP
jgi:hypothetical protein